MLSINRNGFAIKVFAEDNSDLKFIENKILNSIDKVSESLTSGFDLKFSITITLVNARAEYNKAVGFKTENWEIAKTKNNKIIIFHPDVIESETCHKKGCFKQVLVHEMTHAVINTVNMNFLYWVSEGLAQYFADPLHKKIIFSKEDINFFIKNNLYKNSNYYNFLKHNGYEISYWATKYFIEKYGEDKVLELIKVKSSKLGKNGIESIFNKNISIENEIKTALNYQ
jgi:hypothetical protein